MTAATTPSLTTLQSVLSQPRLETYETAMGGLAEPAVRLYTWNAQVSSALMFPLHFAEVAARNAVADALEDVYGPRWPWEHAFERSLPNPGYGFSPRRELRRVRQSEPTAGKVVAELKFVFWQKMFTQRFDGRLWNKRILGLFPNAGTSDKQALRTRIHDDLDTIRALRNRLAHHEPIFSRSLAPELNQTLDLLELRSTQLAAWVRAHEKVSALLAVKP